MNSILETTAKAIYEKWFHEVKGFGGDPYHGSNVGLWKNWELPANAAITAFLEVAAERGWSIRPDKATAEMIETVAAGSEMAGIRLLIQGFDEALNAAAPPFEWDKE